jgi:hypothetical protein
VSVNPFRGDPHPSSREVLDVDPHVGLVVLILRGIRDPEQRAAWLEACLPRTAAMLGVSTNWSAISALPTNGGGELPRRAPVANVGRFASKPCRACGETFLPNGGRQWFCAACRERRARPRTGRYDGLRTYRPRTCVQCGATYTPVNAQQITCSAACRRERNLITSRAWWQAIGSARQQERHAATRPAADSRLDGAGTGGGGALAAFTGSLGDPRLGLWPCVRTDKKLSGGTQTRVSRTRAQSGDETR